MYSPTLAAQQSIDNLRCYNYNTHIKYCAINSNDIVSGHDVDAFIIINNGTIIDNTKMPLGLLYSHKILEIIKSFLGTFYIDCLDYKSPTKF